MIETTKLAPISYNPIGETSIFKGIPEGILKQAKLNLASNSKKCKYKPGTPLYNMELINEINCIIAQRNMRNNVVKPQHEEISKLENKIQKAYGEAKLHIDYKKIAEKIVKRK